MQLIAGNWKMNTLAAEARALAREIAAHAAGVEVMLCPPFTALAAVAAALAGTAVMLGAQDCHAEEAGAYTGDVSAAMLADAGCRGVILGHSERRQGHGETSFAVRAKVQSALRAGLLPIVCVGETKQERDAGAAKSIVCAQVAESVPDGFAGVLAYEPIWAIGTGVTATADDVAAMHAAIRDALLGRLGGSGRCGAHPVRRLGQAGQRGRAAGGAGGRRSVGGWCIPRGGGFFAHHGGGRGADCGGAVPPLEGALF